MKRALVCGAGGFIGAHLVRKLKGLGYWVRAVDIKEHEFTVVPADEFIIADLRRPEDCVKALQISGHKFDEVYQLAADMGGMGFIHTAECEIMHNSALINIHMTHTAAKGGVARYFFSSSVCVYPNMQPGAPEMAEEEAVPANPDNEYGWEKMYAERMAIAYGRKYDMKVRIARFQNCYGAEGTWAGGREKAPAALCRKIALASDGGEIEVWGDGTAIRAFTHVDDMVDGIYLLMQSELNGPVNIGTPEYVTINELVQTISKVAKKTINIKHVQGPVGVQSRNFSNSRIFSLGWRPRIPLEEGIRRTYPWIEQQIFKMNNQRLP